MWVALRAPLPVEARAAALPVACAPLPHLRVFHGPPVLSQQHHDLVPAVARPVQHERSGSVLGEVLGANEVIHRRLAGLTCQQIPAVERAARLLQLPLCTAQGEGSLLAPATYDPAPVAACVALPECLEQTQCLAACLCRLGSCGAQRPAPCREGSEDGGHHPRVEVVGQVGAALPPALIQASRLGVEGTDQAWANRLARVKGMGRSHVRSLLLYSPDVLKPVFGE